jgi:hypothetical protein
MRFLVPRNDKIVLIIINNTYKVQKNLAGIIKSNALMKTIALAQNCRQAGRLQRKAFCFVGFTIFRIIKRLKEALEMFKIVGN